MKTKLVLFVCCYILIQYFIAGTQAQQSSSWDTYSDAWTATDELGRVLPNYNQVGEIKNNKYVGIRYTLWHHDIMLSSDPGAPRDNTSILTNNINALNDSTSPPWGLYDTYAYWGQPLLGYYDDNIDVYVAKKHAQMLSDIGVDVVLIDFTNYYSSGVNNEIFYNWTALINLCNAWSAIRSNGGKTPQIAFFMTWSGANSSSAVTRIYNDFYSQNLYSDLWFMWGGKPLIIADNSSITNSSILNFFTFRKGWPAYTAPTDGNEWSWLSNYPQTPSYTATNTREEVAVGIAQNWNTGLTYMDARDANGNFVARGRSYHNGSEPQNTNPLSTNYPSKYGYNFQEGLSNALMIDPNFLWVEGWNEWIAGRIHNNVFNVADKIPACGVFADQFVPEFSRDIEPTLSGGLGDNYYMQLASAIKQFKGARVPQAASPSVTINIDGNFSDWTNIQPEFKDDIGDKAARNYSGVGNSLTYTNNSGRNDFKLMKVAHDSINVYFYAETVNNITSYNGSNWMMLFIKTNSTDSNWEGYNYIINRTGVTSTTTTLEKSTGGWNWSTISSGIHYIVTGNKMELAIPISNLGITGSAIDIQFKWDDNMQNAGNIYDFYTNGDAAPNGRFNYQYKSASTDSNFIVNNYCAVGSPTAVQISSGQTAAMKFTAGYADDYFNAVEVNCPSYSNNIGNLTLQLFKWNTNYSTTVGGTPIASQVFTNFTDNAMLKLNFTAQPPGDYLWLLSNPTETVGVWKYGSSNTPAVCYFNGSTVTGNYISREDYVPNPFTPWTRVDNMDSRITYSGSWGSGTQAGYFDNTAHWTNLANAYLQFTFTGVGVRWIGCRNADHGKADVFIDGVYQTTVDTYNSTQQLQQTLYTIQGLFYGQHTLKIAWINSKNSSSSGYYIDADAIDIDSVASNGNILTSVTTIDDMSSSITYSGNWSNGTQSGYYNNTAHWTNLANANLQCTFTGAGVRWIGSRNSDHGKAQVFIDNVYQTTIDTYNSALQLQQVLYEYQGSSSLQHTLKIVWIDSTNPGSSGYFIDVDAITIISIINSKITTSTKTLNSDNPRKFELSQNYPNPFNPSTVISYSVPKESRITLKIYNLLGQEVSTLVNTNQKAGTYNVSFDASKLSSGIYFYSLKADGFTNTKKMMLVK